MHMMKKSKSSASWKSWKLLLNHKIYKKKYLSTYSLPESTFLKSSLKPSSVETAASSEGWDNESTNEGTCLKVHADNKYMVKFISTIHEFVNYSI